MTASFFFYLLVLTLFVSESSIRGNSRLDPPLPRLLISRSEAHHVSSIPALTFYNLNNHFYIIRESCSPFLLAVACLEGILNCSLAIETALKLIKNETMPCDGLFTETQIRRQFRSWLLGSVQPLSSLLYLSPCHLLTRSALICGVLESSFLYGVCPLGYPDLPLTQIYEWRVQKPNINL